MSPEFKISKRDAAKAERRITNTLSCYNKTFTNKALASTSAEKLSEAKQFLEGFVLDVALYWRVLSSQLKEQLKRSLKIEENGGFVIVSLPPRFGTLWCVGPVKVGLSHDANSGKRRRE